MKFSNKIIKLAVASALASWSVAGFAGGFGIGVQSGSGTGNAFAGGAAAADDASVVWFNPAAMTALPSGMQLTSAFHVVKPSFKFNNTGSTLNSTTNGDGGDGGDWAYIPNGFFAMSINPSLSFGVALNAPFGLTTNYDAGWRGQLTALKSSIKTVNVNPAVAYKVNNVLSVGAGVSMQMIKAELTQAFNATGTNVFKLKADDIGFGYNFGVTAQPSAATRIGLHYRSEIKYKLDGDASFTLVPGATPVTADLKTPSSASLSMFHQATPSIELMGDVTWTKWSNLQRLTVLRSNGTQFTNLEFQWDDTWRFGLGANYIVNPQTKLRFGVALDKTPTNDTHRSARLPDQDRTWVAFGVQWKPSKQGTMEFGYAHEFVKDAKVNNAVGASNLIGEFKVKADIFSIQYSHRF